MTGLRPLRSRARPPGAVSPLPGPPVDARSDSRQTIAGAHTVARSIRAVQGNEWTLLRRVEVLTTAMNNLFDEEIRGHHGMRDLVLTLVSDADLARKLPGDNPTLGNVLVELGDIQGVYT